MNREITKLPTMPASGYVPINSEYWFEHPDTLRLLAAQEGGDTWSRRHKEGRK